MLPEHPDFARLLKKIREAKCIPWEGTLYRACAPLYANARDLITGAGAMRHGGRWNPPQSHATIYLATTLPGALAETLGLAEAHGFHPSDRLPLTLVSLQARLQRVLDLTSEPLCKFLGVKVKTMMQCPWRAENQARRMALTQALGLAAFTAGCEGILVPSAVHRRFVNLNLFPRQLSAPSHFAIVQSEKLPPPPAPGAS